MKEKRQILPMLQKTVLMAASLMVMNVASAESKNEQLGKKDIVLEKKVDAVLAKLSLEEKVGQMSLRDWSSYKAEDVEKVKQDIRKGKIGGFLNIPRSDVNPAAFDDLQKVAIEESPNGIPLIFGHDVIHGYKTIFPIPLGQAASWNAELVEAGARVAAEEATSVGIRWTFAPMIDISRDARWGRIAESLGEDVHLTSVLGAAMVRGFQGDDLSDPSSLAACGKHFVGYGAAEGGRDYNTTNISERLLRDVYLPPFKAILDAGAPSLMSAYSELDGVPSSADKKILDSILRDEWGFDGFVVSDWNSVMEMIPHGFAKDAKHAAQLSANAGIDFEMHSTSFEEHLPKLITNGLVQEESINEAVKRMLRVKIAMGLYEKPYTEHERQKDILNKGFLEKAKQAAIESFVLLKNENNILPVSAKQEVAVIGPLAEVPYQQLGTWIYEGDKKDSQTLLPAIKSYLKGKNNFHYASGLPYSRSNDTAGFADAIKAAKKSDVVLFFGGEEAILTGEGHSRGDISLPGAQKALLNELTKLGKPVVLVLLAGRPISLEGILDKVDAVLMAWHPGTMAGPALVDVLYGEVSPSGRLPLTWPKSSGQIPVHYDHKHTGRPAATGNYTRINDIDPSVEWQHSPGNSSNYLDYGHTPEFVFGYGLSYASFEYSKVSIEKRKIALGGEIEFSVVVKNTGKTEATDTVQLYIQDVVGNVTRPVKQLKDFSRITLSPGESRKVNFTVSTDALAFHNRDLEYVTEPGEFKAWIAKNAADEENLISFELVESQHKLVNRK
jgi:beta-glucosidase